MDPWAAHEERAGAVVAALCALPDAHWLDDATRAALDEWRATFAALPDDAAGSALMLLVRDFERVPAVYQWEMGGLARRRFTVSRADAFLAARTVPALEFSATYWTAPYVLAMLRRALPKGAVLDADEAAAVTALADVVDTHGDWGGSRSRELRKKLLVLLPAAEDVVDTALVEPGDGWAAAVLPPLAATTAPDAAHLLHHLAAATGSKPAASWLAEARRLSEPPEGEALLRLLVTAVADAEPVTMQLHGWFEHPVVVGDANGGLARAAVWATATLAADWVVPALHRVALRALTETAMVSDKVPNACFTALGTIASPEAIAALQRLSDATRHNGFRTRIAAALTTAAAASGLTPGQLVERVVPTYDLEPDGTATITEATTEARLAVGADLKVAVEWRTPDGWAAKPPETADASDVARAKRRVKEVRDAVAAERRRVESLFADDRVWPFGEWRAYYLDHPVTGRVTRGLIWTFDGVAAVPGSAPPDAAEVRLWHPARATVEEVTAWRSCVVETGLRQPFKQAFREVYLVTPAEVETATYSNRFAAHVLHFDQAYALFKERAWAADYLGRFDGGDLGAARRTFGDAGVMAVFEYANLDPDSDELLAGTDRVWFHRTADRGRAAVPIANVPPLVFSEAMRDVDLFVGVASIAADPTWADRGEDPHYAYWAHATLGELTATAEVRKDALARLLPMLKVADRVSIEGRFVVVRGNRGTYKVHIGSGNVLAEPSGRYLCIVAKRDPRSQRVMLPFEGDVVLSVVLSKVLMLAADDKIKDESILRQLP